MKIVIGSDKVGYSLKESIKAMLTEQGYEVTDVGTVDPEQPRPHTLTGPAAAKMLQSGQAERGILICGTGMGMAIAANKNKGVYAAVVESVYAAEYCRKINDANILCMGAFLIGETMAKDIVNRFLSTAFVEDFPQWRADFLTEQKKVMADHEEKVFR
ncbi:MAG: RpiB/LacA/LacB family sugar-phosphate isomerase [Lachnospiraceae bacterium]|nr:RpiB/LacA/LacB family sugar-phosphate isomerase [Lachnospiraceae bacterium]MCI9657345.1 RpiB/LacA/LacB family sugar-phosphate isomerase [Lachnospiraceae bacterium]